MSRKYTFIISFVNIDLVERHNLAEERSDDSQDCVVGSGFQFPDDVPGKMFLDFPVPGNGLACACLWVLIPIMPPAMSDENAARPFKLADKINPFHANWSSATCRT
jgi:hypothetical protein